MKLTNLKYMEDKGSCGQSSAYNTYATPQTPNPLFLGFSRYQNVNKEIIQENIKSTLHSGTSVLGCFLLYRKVLALGLLDMKRARKLAGTTSKR